MEPPLFHFGPWKKSTRAGKFRFSLVERGRTDRHLFRLALFDRNLRNLGQNI
jgi:hypothetical protein